MKAAIVIPKGWRRLPFNAKTRATDMVLVYIAPGIDMYWELAGDKARCQLRVGDCDDTHWIRHIKS